jgi:hypothetical protein
MDYAPAPPREMAQTARQHRQLVGRRNNGYGEVRESGSLVFAAGAIEQRSGDARGSYVERQNSTAIFSPAQAACPAASVRDFLADACRLKALIVGQQRT